MLEIIKLENADGLRIGDEETGYTQLTDAEAEVIFQEWADARLAKHAKLAEAEAKAEAKIAAQAKLAALGLTVEDLTALGL